MSNTNKDLITLAKIVKKLPEIIPSLPKILTGILLNRSLSAQSEVSLGSIFIKTVRKYPSNNAIMYLDKTYTYDELNNWINKLTDNFTKLGFKKGDVAVLMLENRPEIIAVSMALSKIGCIAALINTAQKSKTLIHSIHLAKSKAILIGAEFIDSYQEIASDINDVPEENKFFIPHPSYSVASGKTTLKEFDIESKSYSKQEPKPSATIKYLDPCMYIYTSGTTGLPKASIISHGRWIKGYSAFGLVTLRLKPTDRLYVPLPLFHATAMIVCWTSVVAGGASIVIKNKFSVSEFWPDINKYKATAFGYVGELCKYLLNSPEHPLEKNNTLTKMIGNGLRAGIWSEFTSRFGIKQVAEFYASSEGNIAFFNVFNFERTMGYTVTGYAIVEYDKENNTPFLDKKGYYKKVKTGGVGLLLGEINQKYPFDGYTEKIKSEGAQLKNVFKKGDAWFNTGDLVRDQGFKHTQFVDRLGDTFRWKGENVSTTEVEEIINNFHGIAESVVYGVEIPDTSGRAGMVSLTLNKPLDQFDFSQLYEFLKKELPPYAIPIFLRISPTVETTATFKNAKNTLKDCGYDCTKTTDPLYVYLKETGYTKINLEIKESIDSGKYRL